MAWLQGQRVEAGVLGCPSPESKDARVGGGGLQPRLTGWVWGRPSVSREPQGEVAGLLVALWDSWHPSPRVVSSGAVRTDLVLSVWGRGLL